MIRQSIFEPARHAVSMMLLFALILLWAVFRPIFQLRDWMTRAGKEARAKKTEARMSDQKIGIGPRAVAAILTFIATECQTRQLERISRAHHSHGNMGITPVMPPIEKDGFPSTTREPIYSIPASRWKN